MKTDSHSEDTFSLRNRFRAATRDAILEAAASIFASDGATRVRMEDIAARAGIAVGTLYNYFHDRTALVEALLERRTSALLDGLDAATRADAAFHARLSRFVGALADHFETNRSLLSVLLDEERSHGQHARTAYRHRSVLKEVLARAERLLAGGVDERVLGDGDPAMYAALLVGMVLGMCKSALAGGNTRLSDAVPSIVGVFLNGASR